MNRNGREWVNVTQITITSTSLGKAHLEDRGSPNSQQKSLKGSTWVQPQKQHNDLNLCTRQTI